MITEKSVVTLHIDIRLKDGSIADSTRTVGRPMEFHMGQEVFSEKFERALLGLKTGDKKKVMLLPEDAFGMPHPANIFRVPKKRFQSVEAPLEVGLIILFTEASGVPRPGIVREIHENELTVDFNHPLAGQVVLFDVEIL